MLQTESPFSSVGRSLSATLLKFSTTVHFKTPTQIKQISHTKLSLKLRWSKVMSNKPVFGGACVWGCELLYGKGVCMTKGPYVHQGGLYDKGVLCTPLELSSHCCVTTELVASLPISREWNRPLMVRLYLYCDQNPKPHVPCNPEQDIATVDILELYLYF